MKRTLLVLVFGLISLPVFASAQDSAPVESAEQMVSDCRPIAAGRIEGNEVTMPDDFRSGLCWGAFLTIYRAIWLVDNTNVDGSKSKSYRPMLSVCPPHHVTETQLIKIFLAFAARHPDLLHEDFFQVAIDSAQEAFPCRR